jgi:hypothetical protein
VGVEQLRTVTSSCWCPRPTSQDVSLALSVHEWADISWLHATSNSLLCQVLLSIKGSHEKIRVTRMHLESAAFLIKKKMAYGMRVHAPPRTALYIQVKVKVVPVL